MSTALNKNSMKNLLLKPVSNKVVQIVSRLWFFSVYAFGLFLTEEYKDSIYILCNEVVCGPIIFIALVALYNLFASYPLFKLEEHKDSDKEL